MLQTRTVPHVQIAAKFAGCAMPPVLAHLCLPLRHTDLLHCHAPAVMYALCRMTAHH